MSYELQTLIASLFPPACPVSVTTVAVTQDAVRLQLTDRRRRHAAQPVRCPHLRCIAVTSAT
jgi:hypothetical protein